MRRVLVTGAGGFIGCNLCVRLSERPDIEVIAFGRSHTRDELFEAAARADFVFHIAGINRPDDQAEFVTGNVKLTQDLCAALAAAGNIAPVVYASSAKASADNAYGRSKRAAEEALLDHARATSAPVYIFRLPNVFGKWARPNYNSAVATFCHNVARGETIDIHDPAAPLELVYIDDVVEAFLAILGGPVHEAGFREVAPHYATSVGEVAEIIQAFPANRATMLIPRVGSGLVRALYSTYLSYLPSEAFDYRVPIHADPRGKFVEMLKTEDSGQFSYFTAGPGVTRGNHYHHSKVEKFLVIAGTAQFEFRHIVTGQTRDIVSRGGEGHVVETIPGWAHNITNVGESELIVMLWANEIFEPARPDTIAMKV